MCKLHGVRLIKGIKIFESMLKKPESIVTSNKAAKSKSQYARTTLSIVIILTRKKMRIKLCIFCK